MAAAGRRQGGRRPCRAMQVAAVASPTFPGPPPLTCRCVFTARSMASGPLHTPPPGPLAALRFPTQYGFSLSVALNVRERIFHGSGLGDPFGRNVAGTRSSRSAGGRHVALRPAMQQTAGCWVGGVIYGCSWPGWLLRWCLVCGAQSKAFACRRTLSRSPAASRTAFPRPDKPPSAPRRRDLRRPAAGVLPRCRAVHRLIPARAVPATVLLTEVSGPRACKVGGGWDQCATRVGPGHCDAPGCGGGRVLPAGCWHPSFSGPDAVQRGGGWPADRLGREACTLAPPGRRHTTPCTFRKALQPAPTPPSAHAAAAAAWSPQLCCPGSQGGWSVCRTHGVDLLLAAGTLHLLAAIRAGTADRMHACPAC